MLRNLRVILVAAFICVMSVTLLPAHTAFAAAGDCAAFAGTVTGVGAGYTTGRIGTFAAGDVASVTVSLATATTVSFRIVADPGGAVTLVGPKTGAGTLSYTVPAGYAGPGIGFVIDSADGTVDVTLSCGAGAGGVGYSVPSGFVQRTILCDVAVYFDTDLGSSTSAKLRNGQVWYVNPKPVTAKKDGRLWTEVYIAGPSLGFIPTSCVGK